MENKTTIVAGCEGQLLSALRRAAEEGDSLVSAVEVLTRLERLDLARPCIVPLDWFAGNEDSSMGSSSDSTVEVPSADNLGHSK